MPKNNLFGDINLENQESKYKALDKENRDKAKAKELDQEISALTGETNQGESWAEKVMNIFGVLETTDKDVKQHLTRFKDLEKVRGKAEGLIKVKNERHEENLKTLDTDIFNLVKGEHVRNEKWQERFYKVRDFANGLSEEDKKKLTNYALLKLGNDIAESAKLLKDLGYPENYDDDKWLEDYKRLKALATSEVKNLLKKEFDFATCEKIETKIIYKAQIEQYEAAIKEASKHKSYETVPVSLVSKYDVLSKQLPTLAFDIAKIVDNFKPGWDYLEKIVLSKKAADEEARQAAAAQEAKRKKDAIEAHQNMLLTIDKDILEIAKMDRNSFWLEAYQEIVKRISQLEQTDKLKLKNLSVVEKMKNDVEPVGQAIKLDEQINHLYYSEQKDEIWIKAVQGVRKAASSQIIKFMLNAGMIEKCEEQIVYVANRKRIQEYRNCLEDGKNGDEFLRFQVDNFLDLDRFLPSFQVDLNKVIPNFDNEWAALKEKMLARDVALTKEEEAQQARLKRLDKKELRRKRRERERKAIFSVRKLFVVIIQAIIIGGLGVGTYFLYQHFPEYAPYAAVFTGVVGVFFFMFDFMYKGDNNSLVSSFIYPTIVTAAVIAGLYYFTNVESLAYDYISPMTYAYAFSGAALIYSVFVLLVLGSGRGHNDRFVTPSAILAFGVSLIGAVIIFVNSFLSFDFNLYIILGACLLALILDLAFNIKNDFFTIYSNLVFLGLAVYLSRFEQFGNLGLFLLLGFAGTVVVKLIIQSFLKVKVSDDNYVKPMLIATSVLFLIIAVPVGLFIYNQSDLMSILVTAGGIFLGGIYLMATTLIYVQFDEDGFVAQVVLFIIGILASIGCIFAPIPGAAFIGLGLGLAIIVPALISRIDGIARLEKYYTLFMILGFTAGVFNVVYAFLPLDILFYLSIGGILAVDFFVFFYVNDTYDYRTIPSFVILSLATVGAIAVTILSIPAATIGIVVFALAIAVPTIYFGWRYTEYEGGTVAFMVLSIIETVIAVGFGIFGLIAYFIL